MALKKVFVRLQLNDRIKITGNVKTDSGSFEIILRCENENNITFQMKVEFGETLKVLCRAVENGTPKNETTETFNEKFKSKDPFKITIDVKFKYFQITVNDNSTLKYYHSLNFDLTRLLRIKWDPSTVHNIEMQTPQYRPFGI